MNEFLIPTVLDETSNLYLSFSQGVGLFLYATHQGVAKTKPDS